jgi:hypothetical protein
MHIPPWRRASQISNSVSNTLFADISIPGKLQVAGILFRTLRSLSLI